MPWGIGEEMWYSTDSGFKAKCVVLKRELEHERVLSQCNCERGREWKSDSG